MRSISFSASTDLSVILCSTMKDLLMFSPAQGDTAIDCFEVSAAEPFLSQGNSCSSVISHSLPPTF